MSRRVKLRGKKIMEYFHEKRKCICVRWLETVGLPLYETKLQVLEGVYSRDLCVYLFGRNYADSYELLGDVIGYERLNASCPTCIRQILGNKESSL